MTRRPLSSSATPAATPVVQARWSASVVAGRCTGCAQGIECGERHLAVRRWEPGDLRARVETWCERCVEATSQTVREERRRGA